ncbi:LTA synthase family protein [Ornithobacterium rhinotracheale]|uniref:Phosphoglycerol transferase family protein, alkaline phosphatase superfamily n=2 Tax=Ornithobacterium rhinotracheale TaxID=28251 RepID=I3ZXN4_ORNRL|nr:alkaline phosphatase family protein [Ornithobacterium rhinotracheale]AFL96468.1 phosphoglycerol transferase family protein, alkaline phosphatase superfamily [Ornithobacterium rhinotracheale DSM 15997]AIP98677.1 sulfatase [Ornithobacterium rhinotracheale ORT-UMN 88]KGB67665.1 sulfatase [Ornithobacterium rhinotracheale H06-030791]MCK0194796.1 sulfatase-like hydrolase/transferase [Ornithobacterium rhinotracheale]MCK0200737.1 sulfatase-like hydrolase/transferase [Ornithobacterium rhinotracheale
MKNILKSRFSLLWAFQITFLLLCFLTRLIFYILSFNSIDFSIINLLKIFGYGLFFDIGAVVFFSLFYLVYLLFFPSRFIGSIVDRVLTFFITGIMLFISLFAIAAEFPFWDEFNVRFNFIAVDYLIYTYEVVENINQSYPIPFLVGGLVLFILVLFFIYYKTKSLYNTFNQKTKFLSRLWVVVGYFLVAAIYIFSVKNTDAEWSQNTYKSELSKNGVYSIFAAYRANELDYSKFYMQLDDKEAYSILKQNLLQKGEKYTNSEFDNIERIVPATSDTLKTPNIILVTIESLSADFLGVFGNKEKLTLFLDSLSSKSIFFTNLYATGTRTVRGMEALTLCVPPTPGNSIVRRLNNDSLFSIATVLKKKNYDLKFIYGGDGYFDNMNTFFGGQGFEIVDRDRGNPLPDFLDTKRYEIEDNEVTFENAWGIADEDIYKQSLKYAQKSYAQNKPFFQFIMTTSNHKPYSFPEGAVDMPQGERESVVRYTDYALEKFIKQAQKEKWFKNTIFVIVADHCASSAGKWEINVEKHHIPAFIYNAGLEKKEDRLCSQIDLMPTLFGYLGWGYDSQFYGENVFEFNKEDERALIGNYRTLGLLKNNIFTELNDRKKYNQYLWDAKNTNLIELKKPVDSLLNLTISYYQTASERFRNGKMKVKN